jgi:large subunit ribosomal protein L4e
MDASTGANTKATVPLPEVFSAPLRADVVRTVFIGMSKNKRQAMGAMYESGYDTAAISWGTGRAVARIPRVPGGGTHRAGQGAFGNMCRGGGMFNPLKTWRKWHRKINVTAKRHALASSIAATAVAPLVMARGHEIMEVAEIPCVISAKAETELTTTKDALKLCKGLGVDAELEKSDASKKVRTGRGKSRNRRYVMRKGPLVVYAESSSTISRAFRNIPGVETCCVERLNLLQLAPGGTFGRFVIWTEGAVA